MIQSDKYEVVDEAVYSISEIFDKKMMDKSVAINYLNKCFEKIENKDNIQCLNLFKNLMEIYGSQIRENIIEINNRKDILKLLLKNFDDYIKLTQEQKNSALYNFVLGLAGLPSKGAFLCLTKEPFLPVSSPSSPGDLASSRASASWSPASRPSSKKAFPSTRSFPRPGHCYSASPSSAGEPSCYSPSSRRKPPASPISSPSSSWRARPSFG